MSRYAKLFAAAAELGAVVVLLPEARPPALIEETDPLPPVAA